MKGSALMKPWRLRLAAAYRARSGSMPGMGSRILGSPMAATVALACLPIAAASSGAYAQGPEVEAYVEPPEVAVGEQFKVRVEVRGAKTVESVLIPELFDFAHCVNPYDPAVEVSVGDEEGGVAANSVTLSYVFVADRSGLFEMRPFRITADGREMETEAVAVLVGRSRVWVEARVEPSQVNVGDEFELSAEVLGSESESFQFIAPDVFDFAEPATGCNGSGRRFQCTLRAIVPGEFPIPPVRVVDRESTYRSNPVTLAVTDEPPKVEIEASLVSGSIWVGGDFVFRVDVVGTHELEQEPEFPEMGDLAEFVGSDEPLPWWGNGEEQKSYTYRFRAIQPGRFEIAPIRVVSHGRTIESEPVSLTIDQVPTGDTVPPDNLFLTTAAAKSRAYVGEPVIVTYNVAHGENHRWPRIGTKAWPSFDDFDVVERPGYTREERVGVSSREQFERLRAHRVALLPRRPGQLVLEAATVEVQVEKPWDMFTRLSEFEREVISYVLTSDPLTLEVLPVPDQGRPISFRGHVGTLEVTSRVNGTGIVVGESVTLEVEVAVDGHVEGLPDPEIDFPSGFAVAEPEIDTVLADHNYKLSGTRTYTYRLTATTPGTFVIPAIEMSYFDPETGSYGTTRTHPFTVTVVPAGAEAR